MERAAFLSALVLALGPGAARAACTLDLNIVPELSMLEIGGVLSKVIDIELQGEPPRVDGACAPLRARAHARRRTVRALAVPGV